MTLRARFVGKDGSLGYRTGFVYTLELRHSFRRWSIRRLPARDGFCPYGSWNAFLRNWELVND